MIRQEIRRALVTYVVNAVGSEHPIGKKATQKFLHLIEDAGKVQTGYDFSIYTYGPFSRTLASEIDFLATKKAIDVVFVGQFGTYEISPGENANEVIELGNDYIQKNKHKIDHILSKLKGKGASELELYSTLVFLMAHVESLTSDDKIVEKLLSLKPKYAKSFVEKTLVDAKLLMAS
jgi:uncharacterized protein